MQVSMKASVKPKSVIRVYGRFFEQIGRIAGEDVAGYGETGMWTRCRKKC